MIIEVIRDNRKRFCSCCKKRIKKGDIVVEYDEVTGYFGSTLKWFAHIRCLISKFSFIEKKIKKKIEAVPKINYIIERYYK